MVEEKVVLMDVRDRLWFVSRSVGVLLTLCVAMMTSAKETTARQPMAMRGPLR